MRERHQRTTSKDRVRYQRQETWSKKHLASLYDQWQRQHKKNIPKKKR